MKNIAKYIFITLIFLNYFNGFSQLVPLFKKNGMYAFSKYGSTTDLNLGVFEDALPINDYLVLAKKENLWGALDLEGNLVIEFENLSIKDDGNFIISQKLIKAKQHFGSNTVQYVVSNFLDGIGFESEKIIRGFKNDTARVYQFPDFSSSLGLESIEYIVYSKNDKNFLTVSLDEYAVNLLNKYHNYKLWDKEKVLVERNGMEGIVDINDKLIIPLRYTEISFSGDELIKVRIGENRGFVDKNGQIKIPLKSNFIFGDFSNGICYSHNYDDNKTNGFFIDKTGKTKFNIDERLDSDFNFSSGLIYLPRKKVFINTSGNVVFKLPPLYDKASNFIGDYAIIKKDDKKYNVIDKSGKVIFKNDYDDIFFFLSQNYSDEDFELGFIDSDEQDMSLNYSSNAHKIHFPAKKYTFSKQNLFKVEQNGNIFFVDKNGLEYVEK